MGLLKRCIRCGEYTLSQTVCPRCGGELRNPAPPKFSLEDRYGKYRRALKELAMKQS
ncbi:RNA-protein complex protein Nop10 [Candidatus Bathyarchaeota archaeon]|nr:MAG: RNA-protein complex protein Nop10 [Candidatus Bathyarchaeota archaeon]